MCLQASSGVNGLILPICWIQEDPDVTLFANKKKSFFYLRYCFIVTPARRHRSTTNQGTGAGEAGAAWDSAI